MKNIMQAMADFRANAVIEKNGLNTFHGNSKYHTIDDLMKGLQTCGDYGLGWSQAFDGNDLLTTVTHMESGENILSRVSIGDYSEAQKWAGAVTYKRRICLVTMFGLSEPDADANETIGTKVKQSETKTVDYDYSGAPYRVFTASGSVQMNTRDIKAWGGALRKAIEVGGNRSEEIGKKNLKEIHRIFKEVGGDNSLHHKTKEALTKAIVSLRDLATSGAENA